MIFDTLEATSKNSAVNKLDKSDRNFHDWYRFVLSYPPHLVRKYITEFNLSEKDILLDPFCGTGTTILEAKINNIPSIGIEANKFAYFASSVKVDWEIDEHTLISVAEEIKTKAILKIETIDFNKEFSLKRFEPEQEKIILKNSISPIPLHKSLVLLDEINSYKKSTYYKYFALAFGNALVYQNSNLKFGPEVGVGKIKKDADVVNNWFEQVVKMHSDLSRSRNKKYANAEVLNSDSRNITNIIKNKKVSAVITSPPYPNEKDYTRTTRLESVMLGFINNKSELRELKKNLLRSNTRGVYKEDNDDNYINDFPDIQNIANQIESIRITLGKTSGFEKLYSKVTKLYFGGIAKHLSELKSILKPNAQLAYVVGDQASFFRVLIPTGKILGDIAQSLGYELVRIDLFRTRFSTATKSELREEVVILKWKGKH